MHKYKNIHYSLDVLHFEFVSVSSRFLWLMSSTVVMRQG